MRSVPDDRTARAVIRDEALRLLAERGPDAVSVRQIAGAARVSPGLVIHHSGAEDRLREAVDAHVLAIFGAMLGELTTPDLYDPGAAGSLAEAGMARWGREMLAIYAAGLKAAPRGEAPGSGGGQR